MDIFIIILIAIGGVIIGAFITYQISKEKVEILLDKEKSSDHYKKSKLFFKYIALVEVLKESKGGYKKESDRNICSSFNNTNYVRKNEYENLEIEFKLLKEKKDDCERTKKKLIKQLEGIKLSSITKSNPTTYNDTNIPKNQSNFTSITENSNQQELDPNIDKSQTQIITYFSIPDSNGSFNLENGKDRKDENTFYSIEFEDNSEYGILKFISSELDIRAIDGIDFYLLPVCEIGNIEIQENANEIIFDTPGKVIKKDDCWVIDPDNKVKIKFA